MVSLTMEIPQFFIGKVIGAPVVQIERVPVPCVDRLTQHEACSQLLVGSCAQAQGHGFP